MKIDVFKVILHWYCVFALRFEYLDGVGLFAIGGASLKPQHLQTMTLITQHKPIERSTDMVFMTKNTHIQAWLNGLYTGNPYGQRMTSKHVAAQRRPGVPRTRDDKTQPKLAPPLAQRTIRRRRISKSKIRLSSR